MEIKSNIALKVCLVTILLLVGLTFSGCVGIRTSPQGGSGGVVADGTLFLCPALKQATGGFGCAAPQTEGKLVAVNTSDGSRLWEVSLEASRPVGGGGFGCAPATVPVAIYGNPAVAGDLVYVGGYTGRIYAISARTRLSQDKYVNETSPQPVIGGPVVGGDRVYLGCSDGKVYALDAASLEPVWEKPFKTGGKIWSTPVIDGDTLYIGSFDKKLYAIDTKTGQEKWEFETEGAIISTPLVYENTVYFSSFDRHLYAVDATDGTAKWEFEADKWFWVKPVICNDTLYAPCLDGRVYILNAETGSEVADALDLGSPISSSPVLVNNLIIVASEEGVVYALDSNTNQEKWKNDDLKGKKEAIYASLCASNGVVYIYTGKQNLYALNAESGAKLWSQTIK